MFSCVQIILKFRFNGIVCVCVCAKHETQEQVSVSDVSVN